MATNKPGTPSHRHGAVTNRYQVWNPKTGMWEKYAADTDEFLAEKETEWKGVSRKGK